MNDPARIPGQVGPEDAKMGERFILVNKHDLNLEHHPTNRVGYTEGVFASDPIGDMHGKIHILVEGGWTDMSGLNRLDRLLDGRGSRVLVKYTESGIKELFEHACATGKLAAAKRLVSHFPNWCSAKTLIRAEVEWELTNADSEYERLLVQCEQAAKTLTRIDTRRHELRAKLSSM